MITVKTFVFNEFQVNTFVLSDESNECIIIDPGCNHTSQQKELTQYITSHALHPVMLVNTHAHIDHIAGNLFVQSTYNIPLAMHEEDRLLLKGARQFADMFAFPIDQLPEPDQFLKDGDEIHFGNTVLIVFHIPGHSPGSITLYSRENNLVIAGDVLFDGSIGRSDFPGGNHNILIKGIMEKLMTLPRETLVYPGHGSVTSIGHEYDTNPFLQGQ
ncbi:MAG: MBL fold metallo-hydrolase [Bacteroidales bacterium]|nr:MBL fold metallo-hydrolase [Bacteroidales bacterium]